MCGCRARAGSWWVDSGWIPYRGTCCVSTCKIQELGREVRVERRGVVEEDPLAVESLEQCECR